MQITELSFVVLIAFACVVLIWALNVLNFLWLRPKRIERCLKKQGLRGTPYTFLVGDLPRISLMVKEATSRPIGITDDISLRVEPFLVDALKRYGENCYIWNGSTPKVMITDPQKVKEIFNRTNDFQKPLPHPLVNLLAAGVASYNGDKWAKHRKIMNPALHLDRLKEMVPTFYQCCTDMITKWEKMVTEKGSVCEIDVWPFLENMTSDVISRTAFGSSYEEGKKIFDLQEEQTELALQVSRTAYIPGWRFIPTRTNKRMVQIDKEIKGALTELIRKKQDAIRDKNTQSKNLLGLMLESNSGQVQGGQMSLDDVIEECKLFYFAGQETTSVLLVWTLAMLAHHQEWQDRAREEVMDMFGRNAPDFQGTGRLKTVTMILYEVLRLYPPAIPLVRAIPKDTKLGDINLPAGAEVILPALLVQRDSSVWGEDALEFKPERFADGVAKATKNQVSFFPFGWGQRNCIGQNFAMIEAKMAIALILQKFKFELSASYTHAPSVIFTVYPQFGVHLNMQKI